MLQQSASKSFNKIILERMKSTVETKLRNHQTGFRKEWLRTDQTTTLYIIVEQSLEWNSSLLVNFVDFEKAFDSLDRKCLWRLVEHCGIPPKYINIIKPLRFNQM